MKKPVIWIGAFLIGVIVIIVAVLTNGPKAKTLTCVLNAGSFTQTTTILYSTEGIHGINEIGNEFTAEDINVFYTYYSTLYNTDDIYELIDSFKTDMESDGKICEIN